MLSRRTSADSIVGRSFVLCAALTLVAGFGVALGARKILGEDKAERRYYESIGKLEEARTSVRSSVSNMREFLLTTDPATQQSSISDLDDARQNIEDFGDISGDSSQESNLENQLSDTANSIGNIMSERSEAGPGAAPRLGDDPQLAAITTSVDSGIGQEITTQTSAIDNERAKRQDDFLLAEIAFLATFICGTLAIVLAALSLKKESLHRRVAEAQHANVKQDMLTIQSMLELSDQRDDLTGLLNREAFNQILEQEYDKNRRAHVAISLVLLDLDQLMHLRESKGSKSADEILRRAAGIVKDSFRNGDVCCRYGDSEIAIILPRTNLQNASVAAERARLQLEQTDWNDCTMTASFGVAQGDYLKERQELVSRTHQALDYARRTGRNRVTAIRAYLPLSA